MNSNYGKSNAKSGSVNGFDFDLGLNSNRSRSLNDQKNPTYSYSSSSSSSYTGYSSKPSTTPSWTYQPNKPSWTHQPAVSNQVGAGSLSGPSSMVGDIFGKSWSSSTPSRTGNSDIGTGKKDPNLFCDLVNSSLGQNKGNSNVPLKNAAPVGVNKSSFSMGSMANSLPKTTSSSKTGGNSGSSDSFGSYTSGYTVNNNGKTNVSLNGNANKSSNIGGPSMKSMAGSGVGVGIGSSKDPFVSLVDFSSKPSGGMTSGINGNSKTKVGDDAFGDFQNASKTNNPNLSSNNFSDPKVNSMGSTAGATYSNFDDFEFAGGSQPSVRSTFADDFGFSSGQSQNQPSVQSTGMNDFDSLFSSTGDTEKGSEGFGNQQFSGGDDWGMDAVFGGNDSGDTTELEGLPPPPAGVSASAAKSRGLDNQKQGQYADAIKWLSWAVILLEKSGDDSGSMEVLSCRASCYKEVGEYKKAVADCTKVLDHDNKNVAALVQRALLYESMEKYKLGAEDLRTVMKLDPGNRLARSTIHRLTKMAG